MHFLHGERGIAPCPEAMGRATSFVLHGVLPVVFGALVYLGFRTKTLVGWAWADAVGVADAGRVLRGHLRSLGVTPPDIVAYTLPDALWVYSLSWIVAALSRGAPRIERLAWLTIPAVLDPLDLLFCASAFALGDGDGRKGENARPRRSHPTRPIKPAETGPCPT